MLGAVIGIIIGLFIGFKLPIEIASGYSLYVSVAILAALDSVIGGIKAEVKEEFDTGVFISGFILNSILAAGLAYVGDILGIPLYYAAVFVFGVRVFTNIASIRRYVLEKMKFKKNK